MVIQLRLLIRVGVAHNERDLEWGQYELLGAQHHVTQLSQADGLLISAVGGATSDNDFVDCLKVDVHDPGVSQFKSGLVEIRLKVRIINLLVPVLHSVVSQQEIDFFGRHPRCRVEALLDLGKGDQTRVLL
jgi:hypothetical protein